MCSNERVCGRPIGIRARGRERKREGGVARESKRERERERAYEGSCKSRLKTQDGFLNGLLEHGRQRETEKEEWGDTEREERDGGTGLRTRGSRVF